MESIILVMLSVISTGFIGLTLYLNENKKSLIKKLNDKKQIAFSEEEAIEKASVKAKNIILEAESEATKIREKNMEQIRSQKKELENEEERLDTREKQIIERSKNLDDRFDKIETQEKSLDQAKKDLRKVRDQLGTQLEHLSQMTKEEAKEELMNKTEEELKALIARKIKEAEYTIQNTSDEKAKEILVDAMQKSATDYVAETTATTIEIESDELKGKIIGKEGRNIRTFEKLTGVDIIVDEAPNQVSLSCFDPIRREVAALALQKLLKDGRVHPGSIEETIKNIKIEIAKEIKRTGEKMAFDTGFSDLPPEIIKLLGRFKYRFSSTK
jgi:ribonuclease Y